MPEIMYQQHNFNSRNYEQTKLYITILKLTNN